MAGALTIRELITRYTFKSDTAPIKRLDNAVAKLKDRAAELDNRIKGAFFSMAKAVTIGAAGVTAAIIKLGSEAEESEDKFKAVFKDQEASVREWSEQVAKSIGRSGFKLREFAAGLQDTFVPLGFARDTAAQMSMNLTELAIDVASFQNKSEPDVIRNFTSALVGNHEAVRDYGIMITQASLDKKIAQLKREMPGFIGQSVEMQKVLARQAMIFDATADAQGNAHSSAGSFANQLRRLKARVEDTAKSIGMKLMPVLSQWLKAAGDWISQNEDLIKTKVTAFLEGMLEVFRKLGKIILWVSDHWKLLSSVIIALIAGRVLFGLGRIVLTVVRLGGALGSVTSGAQAASGAMQATTGAAGGLVGSLGKVGIAGAALQSFFVGWQIGKAIDEATGASDGLAEAMMQPQRLMQRIVHEESLASDKMKRLRDYAEEYADLAKRGLQSVQVAGGKRVALTQEGIQQLLSQKAEQLGITTEQQSTAIPQLLQNISAGGGFAQMGPVAPQAGPVNVGAPQITVNVPPGTEAGQARRTASAVETVLPKALRTAMGNTR